MSDEESHENYDEEEFSVDDIAGVGAVGVGSGNGVGGDGVDDYGTDDFDIQGPSSLLSSAATFGERILLPSNSHKQQSTSIQEQKQQSNSSTAIAARAAGVRLLDHIRAGDVAHAGSQAPSRVSASVQSDTTTQLFNIGVQAPDDLGAPRTSNNNHQQLPTIDSHTKLFLNSAATLIEAAVEETRSAGVLRIAATTALPSTALPSFAEALSAPPTPKTAAANAAAIICGGGSGGGGLSVSENSTAALADAAWLLITAGRRVICIAQSRVRAGDYAIVYGSRIEGNDSWVNDCSASQLSPSSRALTAQNIIGVWAAAKVAPPAPRARAPPPALILTSPLELACVAFSPQGDTLVAGGTAGGVAAWALSEPSWLHETLVATMGDGKYALRFISGLRSPSALALPLRPGLGIKAIAVLVDDAAAAVAEASARGDGLRQENETSGVIMMTATVATGGGIDASTRTVAPRRLAPGAGLCTLLSLSLSAASSSLSTSPSSSYSHLRSDAECVGTGASGGLDFLPLNTPALDITAATPLSPFRIVAIDQGGRAALWVALPLSPPRIGGGDVGAISLEALADTAADVGRAATGLLRLVAGHVGVAPATLLRGAAVLDAVASSGDASILLIATESGDVHLVGRGGGGGG